MAVEWNGIVNEPKHHFKTVDCLQVIMRHTAYCCHLNLLFMVKGQCPAANRALIYTSDKLKQTLFITALLVFLLLASPRYPGPCLAACAGR